MMPHEPTSLTPEERELAQRLARLGPHGEPSPALDARILAAAHDAAARTSTRAHRRWPVALGVAASLALAVGIAWRLRPLPDATPAYQSEAASAVRMTPSPVPAPAEAASDFSTEPSLPVDASATDMAAAAMPQPSEPALQRQERATTPAVAAPPAQEPAVVFDAPTTAAAKAAAPPAPPPAPAAVAAPPMPDKPQAFGASTPAAATRATGDAGREAAAGSDERLLRDAATQADQVGTTRDNAAAPATRDDEPLDDVPPATADSPAVRDAWLQRIRELADAGNIEGARASLHEFVRRYPAYPLPDDLRALER